MIATLPGSDPGHPPQPAGTGVLPGRPDPGHRLLRPGPPVGRDQPGPAPAAAHPGRPGDVRSGQRTVYRSVRRTSRSPPAGASWPAPPAPTRSPCGTSPTRRAPTASLTSTSPGAFTQALAFSPAGTCWPSCTPRHRAGLQPGRPRPPRPHRHGHAAFWSARVPGRAVPARRSALRHLHPGPVGGGVLPRRAHSDRHRQPQEMSANSGRDTIFDWPVTSSGTLGTATATARDAADSQPFITPGDRTVLGSPPAATPGTHGRCPDLPQLDAWLPPPR